jgi:hypothetical protein
MSSVLERKREALAVKAKVLALHAKQSVSEESSQAQYKHVKYCSCCHRPKSSCKGGRDCKDNACTSLDGCACPYLKNQERWHRPEYKAKKAQIALAIMDQVSRFSALGSACSAAGMASLLPRLLFSMTPCMSRHCLAVWSRFRCLWLVCAFLRSIGVGLCRLCESVVALAA